MKSLFLKLNKNQSTLPTEKITNEITHLEIQAASLSTLPKMNKQDQLISFSIHLSSLTEIPGWLFQLPNLEILKIKNSPLKVLPEFSAMPLRILQLSGLELTEIPQTIGLLEKLDSLDLSGNQLSDLPGNLEKLINLGRVNLDKNRFEVLPSCIEKLPRLNHLSMDHNPLTDEEKSRLHQTFGIWF
jgi:Leucine-rich repeat (LRR) protein